MIIDLALEDNIWHIINIPAFRTPSSAANSKKPYTAAKTKIKDDLTSVFKFSWFSK